jgi:putative ABC transport system permease protein
LQQVLPVNAAAAPTMRILATIKIAARALCRNKMRTLLTMLGMIIGVGAVIAMVSISNGAKSQIEAQIASMGQDVVLVFAGSVNRGGSRSGWGWAGTLKIEDAQAIQREIAAVRGVSPEIRTRTQVSAGNQNWYTTIQGESPDYFDIRQWPLVAGACFTEQDVRNATKVALVGKTVAEQLFPGEDPIGQVVRIKCVPFTILGMLRPKGLSVQGQDQDDFIVIPYTSAMKRVQKVTTLGSIVVEAAKPSLVSPVQQQIIELLRQRHRIGPGKEDDFTVRNQQEIADTAIAQSKTMTALLLGVAVISLLVGGIGIMNIMLVSVTERTREIGIRLAIGARQMDILLQFLVEAVTLGVIGGLVGICTGVIASKIIVSQWHWSAILPPEWIALAFAVSAAVGIFFGFYPARKASRLDPIDALRYE